MQKLSFKERDNQTGSYCPCCGIQSYGENGVKVCEHLLFVYLNLADGLEYVSEEIDEFLKGEMNDEDYISDKLKEFEIDGGFIFEETGNLTGVHFMIGYQYTSDE